jgi:signal transduction histidine kinase
MPLDTFGRADGPPGFTMSDRPTPSAVLLVADDLRAAAMLETRLALDRQQFSGSWAVRSATRAAAPMVARHGAIDVAIVDTGSADLVDVVRDLRRAAPAMAVVAIASSHDEADEPDLLRAGAQEVLKSLPTDAIDLARVLRNAIARQAWPRELAASMRGIGIAAEHWPLLDEISRVAAAAATVSDALNGVAQLLVPVAADCAAIALSSEEAPHIAIALRHADRTLEAPMRARIDEWIERSQANDEQSPNDHAWLGDDLRSAIERALAAAGVVVARSAEIRIAGEPLGMLVLGSSASAAHGAEASLARAAAHRLVTALESGATLRRARAAVAARDRAITIVSHDLVTPLTTIQMGAAALLRTDPPNAGFARHVAELIARSATSMQQILHDLLDQASLDAGQVRLEPQPTLIEHVIEAVYDNLARLAEERQILFVCSSPAHMPRVHADPERLLQVLLNLVTNAIKFTPPRGRVELSVRSVQSKITAGVGDAEVAGLVRFAVQDTGAGISADDLSHVFEWFWHSRDAARGGTGLGLAIANALVAAHGSELNVESIPGQGTTFWFELPEFAVQDGLERSAP